MSSDTESVVQTRARDLGRTLQIAGGLQVAVYAMMAILLPQLLRALQPPNTSCGNWTLGLLFWFSLASAFVIQGGVFLAAGSRVKNLEFERGFQQIHRATRVDLAFGALLLFALWSVPVARVLDPNWRDHTWFHGLALVLAVLLVWVGRELRRTVSSWYSVTTFEQGLRSATIGYCFRIAVIVALALLYLIRIYS